MNFRKGRGREDLKINLIPFIDVLLVILIFMNVRSESPLTKLFVGAGFFWMVLLLGQVAIDYISRSWMPEGKMW